MTHADPHTTAAAAADPVPRAVADAQDHRIKTYDGTSLDTLAWPGADADTALDAYVYQSREFLHIWSATIGQARRARLFLTVVEDTAGRPVLWLPLSVEREFGCSILRFPDAGMADYNAPALERDFGRGTTDMAKLWAAILRTLPRVDVVDFVKMPATVWQQPNPLLRIGVALSQDEGYYLPIVGTHADYLAHPSRKGRVRKLGQLFRKLERSGAVQLGEVRDAETVATARAFIEHHKTLQYRRTLGFSQFDRPGVSAFVDRLCASDALATFTRMTVLSLDGNLVGAQLDFVTPRRQQGFMTTFAEAHAFISPGRQVQLHLIERAFADKREVFDLGHGDNPFKHPWMTESLQLCTMSQACSLRGRAFLAARVLRRSMPDTIGSRWMRLLRKSPSGATSEATGEGREI